jgi:hypothetical protein
MKHVTAAACFKQHSAPRYLGGHGSGAISGISPSAIGQDETIRCVGLSNLVDGVLWTPYGCEVKSGSLWLLGYRAFSTDVQIPRLDVSESGNLKVAERSEKMGC